jgi:hypothetical protein
MDSEDDLGARADEHFVAAFELRAAKICGGQVLLLDHGAHGAVEDEDARVERVQERGAAIRGGAHGGIFDASTRAFGNQCGRIAGFAGGINGMERVFCLEEETSV